MPIRDQENWVRRIREGVIALCSAHNDRGWFDSHDLINWLNDHHNTVLSEIVASYEITGHGTPAGDPCRTATQQIGKFIMRELGQIKSGEHESARRVTLTDGSRRDGDLRQLQVADKHDNGPGGA